MSLCRSGDDEFTYSRNAKGGETVRHAQLSDGMVLKFFKAPFVSSDFFALLIYSLYPDYWS